MSNIQMLKERLYKELDSYVGSQALEHSRVKEMRDLAQTIHYLNKIHDHDSGASARGMYRGTYEGYEDGGSYRRGRDAMGRYVSRDMDPHKAELMSKLEELGQTADPQMRQAIDQCMERIERA